MEEEDEEEELSEPKTDLTEGVGDTERLEARLETTRPGGRCGSLDVTAAAVADDDDDDLRW